MIWLKFSSLRSSHVLVFIATTLTTCCNMEAAKSQAEVFGNSFLIASACWAGSYCRIARVLMAMQYLNCQTRRENTAWEATEETHGKKWEKSIPWQVHASTIWLARIQRATFWADRSRLISPNRAVESNTALQERSEKKSRTRRGIMTS